MNRSRRSFLTTQLPAVAAGVAMASLGQTALAAEPLPKIDTHQHLWDLDVFQPPWLKDAPEVLKSSHRPAEYRTAAEGLNIVQAVYMEIDCHPRQHVQEAEYLIELCESKSSPTVAAVISGRPNSPEFTEYIGRFRGSKIIKGVRQVLHTDDALRGLCLEKQFVESMRLLGKLGMSFDLCMRPTELADGVKLADQCKDTRFIVDHCGNADPKAFVTAAKHLQPPWHESESWKRDMAEFAKRKNVVCKISGIVARATPDWNAEQLAPIINHCLKEFGPDRVMFGSDWPVCRLRASLQQWAEALQQVIADRPLAEQRKLFHDNAAAFYGLA